MSNERTREIANELWLSGTDSENIVADYVANSGPVASHIERLEHLIVTEMEARCKVEQLLIDRIEALEARPTPNAKLQVGSTSIDTRAGLSVQDVVELSRALRTP